MLGDRDEEYPQWVRAGGCTQPHKWCLWVTFAGRWGGSQSTSLKAAEKGGMSFALSKFA